MDRSTLQRIRTALKPVFCLVMLLVRAPKKRSSQEETERERAEAAERTRNAMYLTHFGPFTGAASYEILGKELRDGHKRPQSGPRTRTPQRR